MKTEIDAPNRRISPRVLAAFVLAVAFAISGVQPASAATVTIGISGTQPEQVTWYYSTARVSSPAGPMSIPLFIGTSIGVPALTWGIRSSLAAGSASYAKTGTIYAGNSTVFHRVSNGSATIPAAIFYFTVSMGAAGCGCDDDITWNANFRYNKG